MCAVKQNSEPHLLALLDGRVVGAVHRDTRSHLRFIYEESWRTADDSYPVSLSMPLAVSEHRHAAIDAYLWGLLPDNEQTLNHYARTFGVSARSPVALLAHIGADCAGAIQFVPPERCAELEGRSQKITVEWLNEKQIAEELRLAKKTGLPGRDRRTLGRFSLAGAQPKIALFEKGGNWGKALGRTPTTHILKPPSKEYAGFAENEHLCLDLASEIGMPAAKSEVHIFDGEVAIVVERFDRSVDGPNYRRIHQEDACQALSILPWKKYENEGGPGITAIVRLIQENSLEPDVDVTRFIDAMALNWVLAAPDAHAKNYAFLHVPGGGTRLAPLYDIASYLPYIDPRLYELKLAMRIGKEYLVHRIALRDWNAMAAAASLSPAYVSERLDSVLSQIPEAVKAVSDRAISDGLNTRIVGPLAERISSRSRECIDRLATGRSAA